MLVFLVSLPGTGSFAVPIPVSTVLNVPTIQRVDVYPIENCVKVIWNAPIDDDASEITDYAYILNGAVSRMGTGFGYDGRLYSYTICGLYVDNSLSIVPVQSQDIRMSSASAIVQFRATGLGTICNFKLPQPTSDGWTTQISVAAKDYQFGDRFSSPTTLDDNVEMGLIAVFTHYDSPKLPGFRLTATYGAIKPIITGPDSSGNLIISGLRPGQLFGITLVSGCGSGPLTIWGNAKFQAGFTQYPQSSSGFYGSAVIAATIANEWIKVDYLLENQNSTDSIPNCRIFAHDKNGNLIGQVQGLIPINYQLKSTQTKFGEIYLHFKNPTDLEKAAGVKISCI